MSSDADQALWEMFRSEVDTHMAALSDGLLSLERNPGQGQNFDSMMRAAHSIKGAAKIVGIPAAVQVAHVLEDCFVAAREGRLKMSSPLVDVLFTGVDLLSRVAEGQGPADAALADTVRDVTDRIARATRGEPLEPAAQPAAPQVFCPEGKLDSAWVQAHHRDVAAALEQPKAAVRIDFSNVSEIDAIGLAFLDQAAALAAAKNLAMQLDGVGPGVARLLHATGLDRTCRVAAAEG